MERTRLRTAQRRGAAAVAGCRTGQARCGHVRSEPLCSPCGGACHIRELHAVLGAAPHRYAGGVRDDDSERVGGRAEEAVAHDHVAIGVAVGGRAEGGPAAGGNQWQSRVRVRERRGAGHGVSW
eukprot:2030760-Prymnesium_polylepis.1